MNHRQRVRSPLPLAGEVDALEERGGWGRIFPLGQRVWAPPPQPSPASDRAIAFDATSP